MIYAIQHEIALSHFDYVSDMNQYRVQDRWNRAYRIDKPFRGDCEDYAFTLQYQIGGEVWYVILSNHKAHAVLVKDDYVYDNIHFSPIKLGRYNGEFIGIMDYTHHSLTVGKVTVYLK